MSFYAFSSISSSSDDISDLSYYKSFAKKPKEFKALYNASDADSVSISSESSSDSSSSDDFPIPETPKKEKNSKLYNKMKEVSKELYEKEKKKRR